MTIKDRLRHAVFGSPLYRLTLGGAVPETVRGVPPDPWPGDPNLGAAILAGDFPALGRTLRLGEDPWAALPSGQRPQADMHGFGWLRHLRALDSAEATATARRLLEGWIERFGRWHPLAWRPDVIGDRLAHWFANYAFLGAPADGAFRALLLDSAAKQARHLKRSVERSGRGLEAFAAARGLIASGVCLKGFVDALEAGRLLVLRAIDAQALPDGGHAARSPARQLEVLARLIDMRAVLAAAHAEVPVPLQGAIDRMAPMLRGLRHGDGRLALFNGSNEEDEAYIDRVLIESGVRGRPLASAPHTGFQRLSVGRTLLIVDAGAPTAAAMVDAHAGLASFEMSVGRHRVIVNCGAHPDNASEWHWALRATAAHSTLVVDDTNAAELSEPGGKTTRPVTVTCQRQESDGNIVVQLVHDGYGRPFGLTHRRDLYLSASGDDVRGKDVLEGTGGRLFAVRFHLHPEIRASLVEGGDAVLLRLPGGDGWRFLAAGGRLSLEDSVYHGDAAAVRRSRQIVVSGALEGRGATVKWALRRQSAK
jgi:uncharacterized heparinase superfamily protein